MNVVAIPVFNRAEFLAVTLENILKAHNADKNIYLFSCDYGFDKECLKVINDFPLDKVTVKRQKTQYQLGKQSFNVLSAYAEACYLSEKYVFLIEDDIFISPDFFNWHLAVHEKEPNAFCSIAAHNHNTNYITEENDSYYYHGANTDYQSWGVCWDKSVLETSILNHANTAYFNNPVNYLRRIFHQEWIGQHFAEQDGLIRRVRYTLPEKPVLFPHKPRCFHAGFTSYHRNKNNPLRGTLDERIQKVKTIVADPLTYQQHCERPEYYNDSKAIDTDYIHQYKEQVLFKADKA